MALFLAILAIGRMTGAGVMYGWMMAAALNERMSVAGSWWLLSAML